MKTLRKLSILLLLTFFSTIIVAQEKKGVPDHDEAKEVQQVITNLFDGMREGDSSKVHQTFMDDVRMLTTFTTKKGEAKLKEGSLQNFLVGVGSPHKEVWDERIEYIDIKIDGNLAQVWTEYKFYLDDQFLHCGVNAFHLVKLDKEWKIMQLTDTRRKSTCFPIENKKE